MSLSGENRSAILSLMKSRLRSRPGFIILLSCAVSVGAVLRFTMLADQILLDDEWHGLNQVIDASLSDVLTSYDGKDNTSLPLNFYDWLLLHTLGWSEFGIRFPVVLAGVLGLILMPMALRKIAGHRAAVIFAFLLAISPFTIFYSRFSRAYVIIMLLCYLALLFAYYWLDTGERRWGAFFVTVGTFAIYSHPLSVIVVAVPFVIYYSSTIFRWRGLRGPETVGIAVARVELNNIGIVQAALLIPAGVMMLSAESPLPWGEGAPSTAGLAETLTLLSGSTNIIWNLIFYGLALQGTVTLFRRNLLLALMYFVSLLLSIVMLVISRPFGLHVGLVVLRYSIILVPVALSCVAVGIASLLEVLELIPGVNSRSGIPAIRMLGSVIVGCIIVGLYVAGPLPAISKPPNDFTNHSAYQGSYAPLDSEKSDARHVYPGFSIPMDDVPQFYRSLRKRSEVGAIVEYPFDVTNYNNLFYYYQMVHRKRVIAGYCTERNLLGHRAELPPGDEEIHLRMGMLSADQILSRAADPEALKFRNMVDVLDPESLVKSGAGVLIIHKYIMALRFLPRGGHDFVRVRYRSALPIATRCRQVFGPPLYEDEEIICFHIG